MAVITVLY